MYGLITIFSLAVIFSLLFAFLLRYTNLSENTMKYFLMILSFISVFIGGLVTGSKAKRIGLILGGCTGILYTLIIFLYQYLGLELLFTTKQFIYFGGCILTAMMGGIVGVNIGKNSQV